jgi:predicted nucleic acid-binding protein
LTLDRVPGGTRVFVDSTVFVYHFTGASAQCRQFLERSERRELRALTSALVVAEVTHRLMMSEALSLGLVTAGNLARKLRERPELVRQLSLYREQVEKIPMMGVDILRVDLGVLLRAAELRSAYGLMTNDSIVAAGALAAGVDQIASADRDFAALAELRLYAPTDLG